MLYENEFRRLKDFYKALPDAQREIVGVMAALPPLAVIVYGAVLAPLGIIGLGGLLTLAAASAGGTALMMASATGHDVAGSFSGLVKTLWQAVENAFAASPATAAPHPVASGPAIVAATAPATMATMQIPFNTAALRTVTAANDAKPKAPQTAAKSMGAGK